MKGLKMSRGDSLIISKSKIKPEYREVFLTAKRFHEEPNYSDLSSLTNWFDFSNPTNEIDETVLKFLDDEGYDYSKNQIEYWFQHMHPGRELGPHCDYNHKVREFKPGDDGEWIHQANKDEVMSPITIAIFLELTDLEGGEFAISRHTWFDEPRPLWLDDDTRVRIQDAGKELYKPADDDVIYFEGSKYYHWIEPLTKGERKSVNINFWPRDYFIINTDK